jgi:dUTPase
MEYRLTHSNAKKPVKKHPNDIGYDLFTPIAFTLFPGETRKIETGFQCLLDPDVGALFIGRSKLAGFGIDILGGLIDEYTGDWTVVLSNIGRDIMEFRIGDAIAQFILVPKIFKEMNEVFEFPETTRGDKGINSQVERPMDSL